MPWFRVALILPFLLTGCLSFSSSAPTPPNKTTVVVPQQGAPTDCATQPCQ